MSQQPPNSIIKPTYTALAELCKQNIISLQEEIGYFKGLAQKEYISGEPGVEKTMDIITNLLLKVRKEEIEYERLRKIAETGQLIDPH